MNEQTQPIRDLAKARGKKPYASPRILSRELLEAIAGGCTPPPNGTGKGDNVQCEFGPLNS